MDTLDGHPDFIGEFVPDNMSDELCGTTKLPELDMSDHPRAYAHFIRVPVGGGAVHFVPNLWDSDDENNLTRMLSVEEKGHHLASTIIESVDYLFSDAISTTEAIRRLRLIRAAVREHSGLPNAQDQPR